MGRKPHCLSITEGDFYFSDPRDVPCQQTEALLRLPWRASSDLSHAPPVRGLIFLSGAPGAYDPDIIVGECSLPVPGPSQLTGSLVLRPCVSPIHLRISPSTIGRSRNWPPPCLRDARLSARGPREH